MESNMNWILTTVIVIAGVIAQFAVNKYQNGEFKTQIGLLFQRTNEHNEDIVELQTQRTQYLTGKEADEVYLRRKEFELFEKHIDKRFDGVEHGLGKILNHIEILNTK